MNTKKVVSIVLALTSLVLLFVIALLVYRVYNSLNIEGLQDPKAPAAVDALKDIYDVAKPMIPLAGILVLVSFFLYANVSVKYKVAFAALSLLLGAGLFVDLSYFYDSTEQAFALQDQGKAIEAMQAGLLPQEQLVTDGADATVLNQMQTLGGIAFAEGELLLDYTEVLETPVNGVMAMSAFLTLGYFGFLIALSFKVISDLRS